MVLVLLQDAGVHFYPEAGNTRSQRDDGIPAEKQVFQLLSVIPHELGLVNGTTGQIQDHRRVGPIVQHARLLSQPAASTGIVRVRPTKTMQIPGRGAVRVSERAIDSDEMLTRHPAPCDAPLVNKRVGVDLPLRGGIRFPKSRRLRVNAEALNNNSVEKGRGTVFGINN